jgi:hypothetical protein
MKQFKDLKIGDKIAYIDTLFTAEISGIEKVESIIEEIPLIKIKTVNNSDEENISYRTFVVEETSYFQKCGFNIIAPQENAETLHEIFCEGIKTGKKYIANSIKQLLMIQ